MNNTLIQWTNHSHNFWSGCHKVSEGCKYCYMHRIIEGKDQNPNNIIRAHDQYFFLPLKNKISSLYFTCSMSDFFIEEADAWRADAWEVIRKTPHHTWQILTKRPERIKDCLPNDWGNGYKNVWLGVTIENENNFHRANTLAAVDAEIRFISAEPLIGPVDFLQEDEAGNRVIDKYQWVIIGGESGFKTGKYKYRPMQLDWCYTATLDLQLNTQCKVFIKQFGTALGKKYEMKGFHGDDFSLFPKYLKVREFPDVLKKNAEKN